MSTSMKKFWIIVFLLTAFSVQFVRFATALEPLIEPSLSDGKNNRSPASLSRLFEDIGVSHPARMNPCFDLEEHTLKYCTPHSIHKLSEDPEIPEKYRAYLKGVVERENSCDLISAYIGRLCYQENFNRLFKHFSK